MTFQELCRLIRQDPIKGAVAAQQENRSHRGHEWELTAAGYALAEKLYFDQRAQKAFYELYGMATTYIPNPDYLLQHSVLFIREARDGPDAERISSQARAMKGAWSLGWSAEQVLWALTNEGGFSGLKRKTSQTDLAEGAKCGSIEFPSKGGVSDLAEEGENGLALLAPGIDSASAAGPTTAIPSSNLGTSESGLPAASTARNADEKTRRRRSGRYEIDVSDLQEIRVLVSSGQAEPLLAKDGTPSFTLRCHRIPNGNAKWVAIAGSVDCD